MQTNKWDWLTLARNTHFNVVIRRMGGFLAARWGFRVQWPPVELEHEVDHPSQSFGLSHPCDFEMKKISMCTSFVPQIFQHWKYQSMMRYEVFDQTLLRRELSMTSASDDKLTVQRKHAPALAYRGIIEQRCRERDGTPRRRSRSWNNCSLRLLSYWRLSPGSKDGGFPFAEYNNMAHVRTHAHTHYMTLKPVLTLGDNSVFLGCMRTRTWLS